jgi:hypothetical protein
MAQRDNNSLAPVLAAGAALLLFISLLINWYTVEGSAQGLSESIGVARTDTATLLIALVAGVAGFVAFGRFRGIVTGRSELLTGLGLATFLFVLASIIKKPQLLDLLSTAFDKVREQAGGQLPEGTDFGVGLGPGLWIALVGSLLLLGAGLSELGRGTAPQRAGGIAEPGGFSTPPSGPPAPAAQATTPDMPGPPADRSAGWKPDPYGQAAQRYWDGSAWTQHTS